MKRSLAAFVVGACALVTAVCAERLIAPFYGAGPFLSSSALAIALLALALATAAAGRRRPATGAGMGRLFAAAGWTLLVPWIRTPLLVALEGIGLRGATLVAATLFLGVPLALLALGLFEMSEDGAAPPARRESLLVPALLGAACAAPLATWVLIPLLGVSRTLVAAAALEAIAAWLAMARPAPSSAMLVVMAVIGGALTASRFPGVVRDAQRGLVESRTGAESEYRVLDLDDGRYLLADGALQTLISPDSGEPQLRPAAALQILDLFIAPPESMLVLGLRGGASPKRFARAGWRVRVIEPDPLAVRVAEKHLHFLPGEVPVEISDPRRALVTGTGSYPVLIVDAFDRGTLPFHLTTREFFAAARRRLSRDGILAVPVVARGWNDPVVLALAATLRGSFRNVIALPTSEPPNTLGSIVLLASDRDLSLPDERLPQPGDFLMNLEEHWRVVQMNHAWFNRYEPAPAAVLTDDRNPVDRWSDCIEVAAHTEMHQTFGRKWAGW